MGVVQADTAPAAVETVRAAPAKDVKKPSCLANSMQFIMFIGMTLIIACTPIIQERALMVDGKKRSGNSKYMGSSVQWVQFLVSWLVAQAICAIRHGKKGLLECWDMHGVLVLFPISAAFSITGILDMKSVGYIDPSFKKVLDQSKLLITAILNVAVLKRFLSTVQWITVSGVTLGVIAFCLQKFAMAKHGSAGSTALLGVLMAIFTAVLSAGAGVAADFTYKKVKYGLITQIAQGRFSAMIIAFIIQVVECFFTYDPVNQKNYWQYFPFGGTYGGWDSFTFFLVGWMIIKDWFTTWVLKNLDSLWKAMGAAVALPTNYIVCIILGIQNFNAVIFMLVLIVMVDTVGFSMQKREEKQNNGTIKALKKEIEALKSKTATIEFGQAEPEVEPIKEAA